MVLAVFDQFHKDRVSRPDLFDLFGKINPENLDAWLSERKLTVPDDLKEFWRETGGCDLFESETILGPFASSDLGDDVDGMNEYLWQKGMPKEWLAFHTGAWLSAVSMLSGEYATLREPSYDTVQKFRSLDDWYENLVREEYASRYGL
jgi:hypothetical protein